MRDASGIMGKMDGKLTAALIVIAAGMNLFFAGCDTNSGNKPAPAYSSVSISPSNATLTAGQLNTIIFVAAGGTSNYTWAVSTPSLGTITPAANGLSAIYLSTTRAGDNIVEVTDSTSGAATATVTQK